MKPCPFAATAIVALFSAGFAARAETPAAADPLAPLAWIADSCWTGTFANGKTKDFICYEWEFGGKFLRSRHRVVGGEAPYSGETLYSFDRSAGAIHYDYFNSLGDVLRGEVVPTAEGVSFPSERVTIGGQSAEIRSSWKRRGEDAYSAVTERRDGEEWKPLFTIEFRRDAPAAAAAALTPLRPLVGGVWELSGAWPNGAPLRVETRFFRGTADGVIRFETVDLSQGARHPLYDGFYFYDPRRQAVVQWNFKADGTRDESVLGPIDPTGFDVEARKTRSRIVFVAPDEMRWLLSVPGAAAGEWKQILDATYHRRAESVTPAPAPPR